MMAAGGPEVSIVLPAHNEAGNISAIAAAIAQAMAEMLPASLCAGSTTEISGPAAPMHDLFVMLIRLTAPPARSLIPNGDAI